jgi:hypothetical protein
VAGVSGVYQIGQARRAAQRLLSVMRLPPGARRSRTEPAGGGVSLASYAVNVPSAPHLVDLHEFFVVKRSTAADAIGWIEAHRPAGSAQSDSGSDGSAGGDWTSFEFRHGRDLAVSDLVANAVSLRGGRVAVRVDAQTAPTPRLPSAGTGPGMLRVIQSGGMFGSFAYSLRCDPSGGSVPDPRRICSAIAADPALLYSFPGPDHSCPAGESATTLIGVWDHRRLHSTFSVCTGGQEEQAGRWDQLLPQPAALSTVHIDRGIGLVTLGEDEATVVDLLRGTRPPPRLCSACTRWFSAGFSTGYGPHGTEPAGWAVTFNAGKVSRITGDFGLTVDGQYAPRGFNSLQRSLHAFTVRTCGAQHELVHRSGSGTTVIVYRSDVYLRIDLSRTPVMCSRS